MNYSGMSYTLGLAFTLTGTLFALFAPILGWIGVFLTGSDTSSNALCGMQRSGRSRGPQPLPGRGSQHHRRGDGQDDFAPVHCRGRGRDRACRAEGTLLGAAIWQSLLMLGMVCVLTWLQSGLLSFML